MTGTTSSRVGVLDLSVGEQERASALGLIFISLAETGSHDQAPAIPCPNKLISQRDKVCSTSSSVPHGLCKPWYGDHRGRDGSVWQPILPPGPPAPSPPNSSHEVGETCSRKQVDALLHHSTSVPAQHQDRSQG